MKGSSRNKSKLPTTAIIARVVVDYLLEMSYPGTVEKGGVIEGLDTASSASLRLKVPSTSLNELKIHQIRKILRDHPGDSPVYLHIGHGKILRLADEFCVDLDRAVGELRMLLGHDAVML